MHSIHQLQAHNESRGHVQQQQPSQQPTSGPIQQENHANTSSGQQEQQAASMTVLVQLDAAQPANQVADQPILSGLEPNQQQPLSNRAIQSTANQQTPIIHHMAQQQAQPQLHLLRAPCMAKTEQQDHLEQQSMSQQLGHSSRVVTTRQQQQQQQQVEGNTAETQEMVNRWLLDNYEIADGESLPRSTVYNHYISYCRHLRTTPQNAASFGKQIRSVFVGLKTRRLGTRGHSKYHYFGIRAKNHVNLEWLQASEHMANSHEAQRRRPAGCSSMMHDPSQENSNTDQGSESDSTGGDNHSGRLSSLGGSVSNNATSNGAKRPRRLHDAPELVAYGQPMEQPGSHYDEMIDPNQHYVTSSVYYPNGYAGKQDRSWPLDQIDLSSLRQHLGSSETLVDENWPHREQGLIESQISERLRIEPTCDESGNPLDLASFVQVFEGQYKVYYKRMVDLLSKCQFNEVGRLWSEFWRSSTERDKHTDPSGQWASNDPVNTNGNQYHSQTIDSSQHLAQQQQLQHEQHHLVYPQHAQQMLIATNPAEEVSLTFSQLYQLTSLEPMIERINEIDRKLFAAIESFLVPELLSPVPRALIHHIRLFARDFGVWMESLVRGYPEAFVVEKLKSTRAFEHALNRYTSINHLAASARAIWTRRSVLAQISMDLNRIDLRDIEHQVSLMSQARYDTLLESENQEQQHDLAGNGHLDHRHQEAVVGHNGSSNHHSHNNSSSNNNNSDNSNHHLNNNTTTANLHQSTVHDDTENNYIASNGTAHIYCDQSPVHNARAAMQPAQLIQHFLHLLDDPYPANMWPDWCRNLVESRVRGQSLEEARNFILKWNFYVSLIMRELTLRSAPSLGSFQLIRLLFDEYMYYLVVMRLAQAQHKNSIQLMTSSMKFDGMH